MCNIYRYIINQLVEWKNSKDRKPLIVLGARQVGKTYSLLDFGQQQMCYINTDSKIPTNDKIIFSGLP